MCRISYVCSSQDCRSSPRTRLTIMSARLRLILVSAAMQISMFGLLSLCIWNTFWGFHLQRAKDLTVLKIHSQKVEEPMYGPLRNSIHPSIFCCVCGSPCPSPGSPASALSAVSLHLKRNVLCVWTRSGFELSWTWIGLWFFVFSVLASRYTGSARGVVGVLASRDTLVRPPPLWLMELRCLLGSTCRFCFSLHPRHLLWISFCTWRTIKYEVTDDIFTNYM